MSPPYSILFGLAACVVIGSPNLAHAQQAPTVATVEVKAHAIIIGNNAAGPGQEDLHYAEADARRVAAVLDELGGYQFEEPRLLLSPSPLELWSSFDAVQLEIAADQARGQESVLFFYYSGHARSNALDLGQSQVALVDLRARIEAMPASLRVVVLDACQSGAISRVKGAKPAADFSTSSIASLSMTGLAIMASSTAAELSQESDTLEGSYFTHNLVSGLRGAADKNRDGSVTLSEAYAYAYDSTLLATAVSAVGKQHVTLETDLRGKGDVALTRPSEADARMVLPAALTGAVTVSHRNSVVAEINKVAGQPTLLALPTGAYSVIVRKDQKQARACHLRLRSQEVTALDLGNCTAVAIDAGIAKGGPQSQVTLASPPSFVPQWSLEFNIGLRGPSSDAYTDRLETFGYKRPEELLFDVTSHYNIKAYRSMGAHLQLGGSAGRLEADHYRRHTDGASTYDLNWSTTHISAMSRLYQTYLRERLQLFTEASVGVSRATSTLRESEMSRVDTETDYGFALGASVGALVMPLKNFGVALTLGYSYAPTLDNELDETHSGAGLLTSVGLRIAY